MKTLRRLLLKIFHCVAPSRGHHQRLREELQTHLDLLTDELLHQGLPPAEARRQAILKLGPTQPIREAVHAEHGLPFFETLLHDARFALRALRKSPAFTVAAIAILAIAIGATTAAFTLTRSLFLKQLPIPQPQSLVRISLDVHAPTGPIRDLPLNVPFLRTITRHAQAFSSAFGWYPTKTLVQGQQKVQQTSVVLATGNAFQSLRLHPALGRLLKPADDQTGGGPDGWAAVLSYGLWQQNYGARPSVLGRHLSVAGHNVTIVGVAPRGFHGLELGHQPGLYLPLHFEPVLFPKHPHYPLAGNSWLQVWARLAPGVTLAAANAEMPSVFHAAVVENLPAVVQHSPLVHHSRFTVRPGATGWSALRSQYKEPLALFGAMAALLLLAACLNLAGLSWVRASTRGPELAMRSVLGASPLRLIRSVLTESFFVAMAGALLGIPFAWLLADYLLLVLHQHNVTAALSFAPSLPVLAVVCASGILCALLIGAAPSILAARISLQAALRRNTRSLVSGRQTPIRRVLIPLQLAITLLLVTVAGTLSLTVRNLLHVPLGFQPRHVLILPTDFAQLPQKGPALVGLYRQLTARIARVPGIQSASVARFTPLNGSEQLGSFALTSAPDSHYHGYKFQINAVGAGYFATLGTRLLAGRGFSPSPGDNSSCLVNQAAAKSLAGSQPILGQTLRQSTGSMSTGKVTTRLCRVIGIVQNARYRDLRLPAGPMVFYPITPSTPGIRSLALVIRSPSAQTAAAAARQAIHRLAPSSPQLPPLRLTRQVNQSIVSQRLLSVLSGFFAAVALLLSLIGIYSMTATYVVRRRREIGLRVALGARRAAVVRLVTRQLLPTLLAGLLLGAALVYFATRLLRAFVFHITPHSPQVVLFSIGSQLAVALLAVLAPVGRALAIDPQQALREE